MAGDRVDTGLLPAPPAVLGGHPCGGFKSQQAVEAFIWVQGGLAPSDQVNIHSGEVSLCSSFKGWCQGPPEVPATPGSILLAQEILD